MDINQKLQLEQPWRESEDFARDDSSLIVGVYASGVFDEAEAWHLAALISSRSRPSRSGMAALQRARCRLPSLVNPSRCRYNGPTGNTR